MPSEVALDVLLHTVGLSHERDHHACWRNQYVTGPATSPAVSELRMARLVVEVPAPSFLPPGQRVFIATNAGKATALEEHERRRPRLTRGQRRYHAWLDVSDAWNITFGEFLRRRLYDPAVMERELIEAEAASRRSWLRTYGLDDDYDDSGAIPF